MASAAVGKRIRLERVVPAGGSKILVATLDDSLLAGPRGQLLDPCRLVRTVIAGGANAILGFRGLFLRCPAAQSGDFARIVNVTASTTLGLHTRKTLVGAVDDALRLGADAVAVHINISSKFENEMLAIFGAVARECDCAGVPLLAIAYPRKEAAIGDDNYESLYATDRSAYATLVRHTARVAVDLGADIVKTQYTGDLETFASVVEVCAPVPVLMAGGPLVPEEEIFARIATAIAAGASGASIGRNIFEREDAGQFLQRLAKLLRTSDSTT